MHILPKSGVLIGVVLMSFSHTEGSVQKVSNTLYLERGAEGCSMKGVTLSQGGTQKVSDQDFFSPPPPSY